MAKSRLEPNKIVRYAESNIPKNGIGTRPAPRVQRTPAAASPADSANSSLSSAADAGTSVNTGGSTTPPPPPPPPGPEETRAFLFDGSTKLTSSLDPSNSSDNFIGSGTIFTTFSPGWASNETGSFTLFSVGRPQDAAASTWKVLIKRVLGNDGIYRDQLWTELTSGSIYKKQGVLLSNYSPYLYSGSTLLTDPLTLGVYIVAGEIQWTETVAQSTGRTTRASGKWYNQSNTTGSYGVDGRWNFFTKEWNNSPELRAEYELTVGGEAATSDNLFTGSIANLTIFRTQKQIKPPFPYEYKNSNANGLGRHYIFEGDLIAQQGATLGVSGSELYISSSL